MARSSIWLYTGGGNPSKAVVTSQENVAASSLPELILGTSEPFTFNFTDGTNVAPSFCNANTHTLAVAISTCEAGDVEPLFYSDNFAQTATGWSGEIALTSAALYGHVSADPAVSVNVPKSKLWLQATVIRTADDQRVSYALAPVYVWARAMPDTFPENTVTPAKRFAEWAEDVGENVVLANAYAQAAAVSAQSAGANAVNASSNAASSASSAIAANTSALAAAIAQLAAVSAQRSAQDAATNASVANASAQGAATNAATYSGRASANADISYSNAIVAAASAVVASSNAATATAAATAASSNAAAAAVSASAASASANSAAASASAAANFVANVSIVFVSMPTATNSSGAPGQMAIDGDKLAIYRNGTGWVFFVGYQV